MTDKIFQPEWLSAPGATINEILKQQKLSAEQFSKLMDYSLERAAKLLSGRTAITLEVAELLAKKLGGSSEFWMSREDQFRGDLARLQSQGDHAAAKLWLSQLPIQDMIKFKWISPASTTEERIVACLKFFGVPNVSAWRARYRDELSAVLFRTSPTYESEPGAVLAWLRFGELKSAQIECKVWDAKKFASELPAIRKLTRAKDPKSFILELRRICASCGVAVVIARAPTGCRASGATRFLSPQKAMILLSFRYLSDDQFWFTFFHEAGHLLLHNHKALFLEDGSDVTAKEENEANGFSEDILVPAKSRSTLPKAPLTKHDIMQAAVKIGVSRGIVVGQLQHLKRLDPTQFNWMKRRYNWNQIEP